jgi:hypothetical protein
MRRSWVVALLATVFLGVPTAVSEEQPRVTRADGGSIQTVLSPNIVVSKGSSLRREWIATHDPACPAELVGTPGVTTVYVPDKYRGEYVYRAKWTIAATEPLAAIEVRFVCFDVWGEFVKTLRSVEITDVPTGRHTFDGEWSLYSENEVGAHYASIAYVSRVRTRAGRVIQGDSSAALEEAKRFSSKFTPANLEPEAPPKPGGK